MARTTENDYDVATNIIFKTNIFADDIEKQYNDKIFCDPVHGQLAFHPLCIAIIDTPQFQRLRHIKQLGFCYTVYPGAVHDRFSHSLGVSYLSGKLLREIKNNQPQLNITHKEILCIEIAGLCHDLGHGPFSHVWERFMQVEYDCRNKEKGEKPSWKHEEVSLNVFDYMIEENNLKKKFKKYDITDDDIMFIKDVILGKVNENRTFLYQIVNNGESGLDVDKWDYFLRDCLYLGIKCGFEYERLIQFARVIKIDEKERICFRDKVMSTVYSMFRTRNELHQLAYKHRVSCIIEKMFLDAVHAADGKVIGPGGKPLKFFDWTNSVIGIDASKGDFKQNMRNYCTLTDDLVFCALKYCQLNEMEDKVTNNTEKWWEKVTKIMNAIETRSQNPDFYQFITKWNIKNIETEKNIQKEIAKYVHSAVQEICYFKRCITDYLTIKPEDVIVQILIINWGGKDKNPVNSVYFYSKNESDRAFLHNEEDVKWMLPNTFQEIQVQVICSKGGNAAFEVVKLCCDMYKEEMKKYIK